MPNNQHIELIARAEQLKQKLMQYAALSPDTECDLPYALSAALYISPSERTQDVARRVLGKLYLEPMAALISDMKHALETLINTEK